MPKTRASERALAGISYTDRADQNGENTGLVEQEMSAFFILLAIFVPIAAMVIVPFWLRERTKQSAHRLISEAIAKGQALDPATMDRLTESVRLTDQRQQQQSSPRRSLGNGIVLLALGGAFAAIDYFQSSPPHFGNGLEWPALILSALGAAFTLLAVVDYVTQKKTDK